MLLVRSLVLIQIVFALLLNILGGFLFSASSTKVCSQTFSLSFFCHQDQLSSILMSIFVINIVLVVMTKKLKPVIWGSCLGGFLLTSISGILSKINPGLMNIKLALVQAFLMVGVLVFAIYSEHKGFFVLKKSRSSVGNQHAAARWISNLIILNILLKTYLLYTNAGNLLFTQGGYEIVLFATYFDFVILAASTLFALSMLRISFLSAFVTMGIAGFAFYYKESSYSYVTFILLLTIFIKSSFYLKSQRMVGQREGPSYLEDVFDLCKPRLSSLVIFTAALGMFLAPGEMGFLKAFLGVFATTGVVAGSCAINCYLERDVDKFMLRTANRPLPRGRIPKSHALVFGILCHIIFLTILYFATNLLTMGLAIIATVSYIAVYTPMKRKSSWAVVVGAIPGAIPPLMGWTMVTNSIDPMGLVLFGILFVWQLPHFMAIATFRLEEYKQAGLVVTPIVSGLNATRYWIFVTTIVLAAVSLLPLKYASHGNNYFIFCTILGAGFLGLAFYGLFIQNETKIKYWAKRYFWGSIIYLPVLFLGLVFLS